MFDHPLQRLNLSSCSDAVGVFVKNVVPDSAADQSGNIRVHDRLIAVRTRVCWLGQPHQKSTVRPDLCSSRCPQLDGISLHGMTNQEVLEVMKQTGQTVVLTVIRRKPRTLERSLDKGQPLVLLKNILNNQKLHSFRDS